MRVLLKKRNLYLKTTWITRLKNGSLIGWFLDNEDFIQNFPSEIKSYEIHYHYPIKGQFHFSYKYRIEDFKYEIRAYKNHLNTKIWGNINDIQSRNIFLPDFKKFNEFFLIDSSDIINLEDPNLVKQISSIGFNISTEKIHSKISNLGQKIIPKKSDIIIDVDKLGEVFISSTILIYNNPKNVSMKSFETDDHIRISNYDRNPAIELIVSISKS